MRYFFVRWPGLAVASVLFVSTAFPQGLTHTWKSLYVFGDSYSDSGAGYIDGNGPTAVVYLADALKIPFTYTGDSVSGNGGLNFAVSGAQTGSGEGYRVRQAAAACGRKESLLGRGMQNQVADFGQRVRTATLHFDPEATLFFLAGGLNDWSLPTATTIANLEGEVRALHEFGARYVLVALMPTKLSPDTKRYKALNKAIGILHSRLQSELPKLRFAVSHWGVYFDEVFQSPSRYGITNTKDKCAGRALFGEDDTPCANPDTYFFYHEGHPSTAVHRVVGLKLKQEISDIYP
jgi:phospholipase/lecithinase/hemolysin